VAWQTADACNKASPHSCRPLSIAAIPHCLLCVADCNAIDIVVLQLLCCCPGCPPASTCWPWCSRWCPQWCCTRCVGWCGWLGGSVGRKLVLAHQLFPPAVAACLCNPRPNPSSTFQDGHALTLPCSCHRSSCPSYSSPSSSRLSSGTAPRTSPTARASSSECWASAVPMQRTADRSKALGTACRARICQHLSSCSVLILFSITLFAFVCVISCRAWTAAVQNTGTKEQAALDTGRRAEGEHRARHTDAWGLTNKGGISKLRGHVVGGDERKRQH